MSPVPAPFDSEFRRFVTNMTKIKFGFDFVLSFVASCVLIKDENYLDLLLYQVLMSTMLMNLSKGRRKKTSSQASELR